MGAASLKLSDLSKINPALRLRGCPGYRVIKSAKERKNANFNVPQHDLHYSLILAAPYIQLCDHVSSPCSLESEYEFLALQMLAGEYVSPRDWDKFRPSARIAKSAMKEVNTVECSGIMKTPTGYQKCDHSRCSPAYAGQFFFDNIWNDESFKVHFHGTL